MKPNPNPDDEEPLRAVLCEWVVDTPLPPRFQNEVWRRIARSETRPTPLAMLRSTLLTLQPSFARPGFALTYVATLLVLGVAAGLVTAQIKSSRLNASLSVRYVQTVDPYRPDTSQP